VKVTPENCFHLTVEIVKEIHAAALEGFGGAEGLREPSLLESAVAAPQVTIGGYSPFADQSEVAAAYLFYLCRNHPFLDGNKRTAFGACLVFLRLNGVEPKPDSVKWESLTFAIADARIDRDEATKQLRLLLPKEKSAKKKRKRK
jgi:death-on-curing protein